MAQSFQRLQRYLGPFSALIFALAAGTLSAQTSPVDSAPVQRRIKPTVATEDCGGENCHGSLLGRKVMHGPAAQKKCLDCHHYEEVAQHRFKRLAAPDQGCIACHEMKHKAMLHAPVREGRCTACHDPHGSDYAKMLVADPAKGLCETCHKQESFAKKKFVHTPVASGSCGACHEAHSAAQPHLLRQPPSSLCTSCHKQLVVSPGQVTSTMSIHAPARDDCMACHDPHASNLKSQLKQAVPDLCLACHKSVKDSLASSRVVHGNMTEDGSCMKCHDPHLSRLPKLAKQTQPDLCLSCHDRTLQTADGKPLTDMAALLKDNPEHHGPIRLGACTACHQPHAGNEAKLLVAAYPPEFYAPFQVDRYKLCFTCHSPDLVLKREGGPTGFANGATNLHAVHVNQEKGRTCRACHEVHASREPFHIRESVPFGPSGWPINIRYRKTATGGSCAPGCHVERSYDHAQRPRSIPFVALTPKGQALVNPEVAKAGPTTATTAPAGMAGRGTYPVPAPPFTPGVFPCTGCHDPALAVNTQRRGIGKPHEDIQLHHDEEHRWCLDCHNAQNRDVLRSAAGEPIPFAESYRLCGQCHGLQYRDWKTGVHGKRTGEWNGPKDYLLCVHCHNPHSPKFKQITPLPPPVRPNSVQANEVR